MKKSPARGRTLALLVVVCALASVCAFAATAFIRSPQQQAVEAAAPSPSTLTAAVEERALVETVVLRGAMGSEYTASITGPGPGVAGDPVVTGKPLDNGDEILAGTVVVEIAGRPVIALPGEFPMYRDLSPGMEGKDVTQLQEALVALGFSLPEINGVFGPGTQRAVEAMYENRGYQALEGGAPGPGPAPDAGEDDGGDGDEVPQPEAAAEDGPVVPRGELAFLPSFPSSVRSSQVQIGELAEGPVMEVSSGALAATTAVSDREYDLIGVGDPVTVHSEAHGEEFEARVESILPPDEATEDAPEQEGYQVLITGDFDERLVGADVRLTIEVSSTGGEVMAVPSSAVFARHDGSTYLVAPDGTETEVATGVSAGGWVQIDSDEISPGDTVVVSDT